MMNSGQNFQRACSSNRKNTTRERRCIHIEITQTQKTYIADHIYRSTYFHDADAGLHQFHSAEEHGN